MQALVKYQKGPGNVELRDVAEPEPARRIQIVKEHGNADVPHVQLDLDPATALMRWR